MPYTPYTYTSPDDPAREDEGLFGPGSVTWRVMNNRIMWVAIVRALYLQALHPRVIRGTLQNAATITQPVDAWARLRRTRKFIETRTFGTMAEAERAGRRVPQNPTMGIARARCRFNTLEPGEIDDGVVLGLVARMRAAGFHAFVVPQAPDLPMANRREDILIIRP